MEHKHSKHKSQERLPHLYIVPHSSKYLLHTSFHSSENLGSHPTYHTFIVRRYLIPKHPNISFPHINTIYGRSKHFYIFLQRYTSFIILFYRQKTTATYTLTQTISKLPPSPNILPTFNSSVSTNPSFRSTTLERPKSENRINTTSGVLFSISVLTVAILILGVFVKFKIYSCKMHANKRMKLQQK